MRAGSARRLDGSDRSQHQVHFDDVLGIDETIAEVKKVVKILKNKKK